MPISYHIDHERRLVVAEAHGALAPEDVFGYQNEVWSRPDVAGYDELVDMSDVKRIVVSSGGQVRHLAAVAAAMPSSRSSSRFAIVAPTDIAFGLARMFQTFRAIEDGGTRDVQVFRTREEARDFLGLERTASGDPPRS